MRKNVAFIRGRRLIIFLFVSAAFIRGRRLFEGGVYSREAFIRVITVVYIQTSFHPHPQAVKYLLKPTNHNSEIDNFISATEESRHVFTDRNQLTDRNIYYIVRSEIAKNTQ